MDPVPIERLDRDWRRELANPRLRHRFHAWRAEQPALAGFADPAAMLRFLAPGADPAAKDRVLGALIACAREEPLAARVVLQALAPGLKALARRLLIDVEEREELWSLLLAAAWELIRAYPLERRPRRIAANVLLDTQKRALGQLRKARAQNALALERFDRPPLARGQDGTSVDRLLLSAVAEGVLDAQEAELVLSSRVEHEPLASIARTTGVTYDALRVRRQRAEQRLVRWLAERDVFGLGGQAGLSRVLGSPATRSSQAWPAQQASRSLERR